MSKPTLAPNSTTSFWRSQPHTLDNHRSTPELPAECDSVIIGAGYAGASVAHHILKLTESEPEESRPRIVILEGREACSGATGRNGGHLKPDPYNRFASLATEHGIEAATEVAEFEEAQVDAVHKLVVDEGIDCDMVVTEAIDVNIDAAHGEYMKGGYDMLVEKGCGPTVRTRYTGAKEAEEHSGLKGAKACFTYKAAHIWPYKLIMHLLNRALQRGVNLQTHTPVTSIAHSPETDRYTVTTSRGTLKCKTIIHATNGYTCSLLPQYTNAIIPVRGTCSRITVPSSFYSSPSTSPNTIKPLKNSYMIRHNAANYDYLIPRPDGSIIVGGARESFIQDPDNWYNVSDDSVVLEAAKRYFDGYMQRHFLGWEDSGARTEGVWTGIMGYSADNLPHIGHVPGQDNQFIIAGFTGHGMPQVYLAAEGIAKIVLRGSTYKESGLPRLFETTKSRLESGVNRIVVPNKKREEGKARL